MTGIRRQFVMIMTFALLALTLAPSQQPAVVVAAIAAVTLAALLSARLASAAAQRHEITIGSRARAHRESLEAKPEPQHPDTAGRPRTRPPARPPLAA